MVKIDWNTTTDLLKDFWGGDYVVTVLDAYNDEQYDLMSVYDWVVEQLGYMYSELWEPEENIIQITLYFIDKTILVQVENYDD